MKGKMIYIYILELTSGKWYIGIATDPEKRMKRHQAREGARICIYDPPVKMIKKLATGTAEREEAMLLEDWVTVKAMIEKGARNVIGGRYIEKMYRNPPEIWKEIEKERIEDEIKRNEILYRQWSIRFCPYVSDGSPEGQTFFHVGKKFDQKTLASPSMGQH